MHRKCKAHIAQEAHRTRKATVASIFGKHDQKHRHYKKNAVPLYQTITLITLRHNDTDTRTYATFVPFEPHNKPLMVQNLIW